MTSSSTPTGSKCKTHPFLQNRQTLLPKSNPEDRRFPCTGAHECRRVSEKETGQKKDRNEKRLGQHKGLGYITNHTQTLFFNSVRRGKGFEDVRDDGGTVVTGRYQTLSQNFSMRYPRCQLAPCFSTSSQQGDSARPKALNRQ